MTQLEKELMSDGDLPNFRESFAITLRVEKCEDISSLVYDLNKHINLKKDKTGVGQGYPLNLPDFNKEIAQRWLRTGLVKSNERVYWQAMGDMFKIPHKSETRKVFSQAIDSEYTFHGKIANLRTKYIKLAGLGLGAANPSKGYIAGFLQEVIEQSEVELDDLAIELRLKPEDMKALLEGKLESFGNFKETFNIENDEKFARAVVKLYEMDKIRQQEKPPITKRKETVITLAEKIGDLDFETPESKAMIVFDACALKALAAPVSKASSPLTETIDNYLGMIQVLSQLPNVERIVVPDIIVWEALGKVDGRQVDKSFLDSMNRKSKGFSEIDSVLQLASVRDSDGNIIQSGSLDKLEIRDTDHPLMVAIRNWDADHQNYHLEGTAHFAKIQGEFSGADYGERIIRDYLSESLRYEGPVFFVSDDNQALADLANTQTASGNSITSVSSLGLINGVVKSVIGAELGIKNQKNLLQVRNDLHTYIVTGSNGTSQKDSGFLSRPIMDYQGAKSDGSQGVTFLAFMQSLELQKEIKSQTPIIEAEALVEPEKEVVKPVIQEEKPKKKIIKPAAEREKPAKPKKEIAKHNVGEEKVKTPINSIMQEAGLGFLIRNRRIELSLSQKELAEKVREELLKDTLKTEPFTEITEAVIREWELVRTLPEESQFEALQRVLIDQDPRLSEREALSLREEFSKEYNKIKDIKNPSISDVAKLQDLIESRKESLGLYRQELAEEVNKELFKDHRNNIETKLSQIDEVYVSNLEAEFGLQEKPNANIIGGFVAALDEKDNRKQYAKAYQQMPESPKRFLQGLLSGKPQDVVTEIITEKKPAEASLSEKFNSVRDNMYLLFKTSRELPSVAYLDDKIDLSSMTFTQLLSSSTKPYVSGKLINITERTENALLDALESLPLQESQLAERKDSLKTYITEYRDLAAAIEENKEEIIPVSRKERAYRLAQGASAKTTNKSSEFKPSSVIAGEIWSLFTEQDGEKMELDRISDLSKGALDIDTLSKTLGSTKVGRVEITEELSDKLQVALKRSGESTASIGGLVSSYNKSLANEKSISATSIAG